jgi:hypothetical protein
VNRDLSSMFHPPTERPKFQIAFPSQSVLLKRAVPWFAGRDADPVLILLHRS